MNKPFLCDAISDLTASAPNTTLCHINRRGIDCGWINSALNNSSGSEQAPVGDEKALWNANQPIYLPSFLSDSIEAYSFEIGTSADLYQNILSGKDIDFLLDQPIYMEKFGDKFELLSTRFDEADRQELISVDFDVLENGELVLEDIWMRVSWLSFLENEQSLRFRFSFGMEGFDDVSLDLERQLAAAELCDRIFPESAIICENEKLKTLISDIANIEDFYYLERIVYYNAKNGGAQFHHDAEKGHLGVVYAQLSGQTLWITLSKRQLMAEIQGFLTLDDNKSELQAVIKDKAGFENILKTEKDLILLESMLDSPANDEISELLNESPRFFAHMMKTDFVYALQAGDMILLPQESMENCAWHSVFCLGDTPGQALSFAIKSR